MSNRVHEVLAYLSVKSVDAAMDFYQQAFGAAEHFRLAGPDGHIAHAEMHLGDTILMMAEEFPDMGIAAPEPGAAVSVSIHLLVDDADAMFESAVAAGATAESAMEDQFYGQRSGALRDPFGYRWLLGQTIEEVSVEEMQNRFNKLFEANGAMPQPDEKAVNGYELDSFDNPIRE